MCGKCGSVAKRPKTRPLGVRARRVAGGFGSVTLVASIAGVTEEVGGSLKLGAPTKRECPLKRDKGGLRRLTHQL